jgi:hypothetical protein
MLFERISGIWLAQSTCFEAFYFDTTKNSIQHAFDCQVIMIESVHMALLPLTV